MENSAGRLAHPAHPHHRVPGWVGDLLAGVLIVVAAFIPFPGHEFRPSSLFAFAVVVFPALLLPFRRRWPIPVLVACIALYGVAAFHGTLAPGIVLASAIAMFGVATRNTRRTTILTAVAAVLAVTLLSLLASIGSVLDPRAFQFAVTIAFASAAGDATRSRREYIAAITDRAIRAEATRESEAQRRVTEERLRIARDLHDAVAHQISVISLNAGVASSAVETRPEKAKEALSTIRVAARAVLREIGDLLEVLRSDQDETPVVTVPQPGLDRLDALVRQFTEAGLNVTVRVEGDATRLSGAVDHVAYRIIQEALTNAHKHGADDRAHVLIDVTTETVRIVVTNPASPFGNHSSQSAERVGGHGLIGLGERVSSVRGAVETGVVPGGYRVSATLPLQKASQQ